MTTILLCTRCALMWTMWGYREITQRSFMFIFSLILEKCLQLSLLKHVPIWYCLFFHIIGKLGLPKPYDSVRNQKQKCVTLAQKKFPYMLRSYVSKYSLLSFQSLIQKSSSLGFWCLLNGSFLNSFEIVKIFKFMELNYCTLCKPP